MVIKYKLTASKTLKKASEAFNKRKKPKAPFKGKSKVRLSTKKKKGTKSFGMKTPVFKEMKTGL